LWPARDVVDASTSLVCRKDSSADIICKFCGFLAQVKATTSSGGKLPKRALGGSWKPQHEQILADIFHSLFVVSMTKDLKVEAIYYVPSHVLRATPSVYEPRAPLADTTQRAGWTGFNYNLSKLPDVGVYLAYPPE
jgi:type II restriction enzyme